MRGLCRIGSSTALDSLSTRFLKYGHVFKRSECGAAPRAAAASHAAWPEADRGSAAAKIERKRAYQQFAEDHAERVDVGARVDVFADRAGIPFCLLHFRASQE